MDARMVDRLRRVPPEVLGSRIKSARIAMGLTQLALADGDVTISFVSRIESGKRRLDPTLLERFAERLEVPVIDLLADEVDLSVPNLAQVEIEFAEVALMLGDATGALGRIDVVLTGTDELSIADRNRAGFLRARALEHTGDVHRAIDLLEDLVATESAADQKVALGIALSRCYRAAGDLTRAITSGDALLADLAARGLGASREALTLTAIIAAGRVEHGDTDRAVLLCRETLALVASSARAQDRATAYWTAGIHDLENGDTTSAVALARRAQAVLGDGDDARALARLQTELATMLLRLDDPPLDEASEHLLSAREAFEALSGADEDLVDLARTRVALARSLSLERKYAEAESAALACTEALGDHAPLLAAEAAYVAGGAASDLGDAARAQRHLMSVVDHLGKVGADRAAGPLWMDVGDLLTSLNDAEGAARAYRSAAASTGLVLRSPAPVPSSSLT